MSKEFNISELQEYFSEEILLKYLNNQLSDEDNEKVEYLLQHDKMYSDLFDGLLLMDEPEDIFTEKVELDKKIDTYSRNKKKQMQRRYIRFRSIAAVILVLLSSTVVLLFINNLYTDTKQVVNLELYANSTVSTDLDYYEPKRINKLESETSEDINLTGINKSILLSEDTVSTYQSITARSQPVADIDKIDSKNIHHNQHFGPLSFAMVEEKPEFPGGEDALKNFISTNSRYPVEAKTTSSEGKVLVQFTIDVDGKVTDAKVVREIDPFLDKEALRVVNTMPQWTPGKQGGKNVEVTYIIPIHFRLD